MGFSLCELLEYSYVVIFPQITQMTQRNAAELYYFAEKDRLVRLMWFWVFGFRLRKSAGSAGDIGVSSVYID